MAQDGKDDYKLEFTPEGETLGYISLDQARVLAFQHARDNREIYGRYADSELVWDVVSTEETEDYYEVRLSYRPARDFRGRPGVEQFTIDKTGPIEIRQVVSEPHPSDARNLGLVALATIIAVGATIGGLFASGALTSSSNDGNNGVVAAAPVIVSIVPDSPARLISPDGDVTIDVGAGSVDIASQLMYQSVSSGEIPLLTGAFRATGKVFDLTADAPLLSPITITVRISAAEVVLAGSREENIVIQHYREGAWAQLVTEVDLGRSTATAQVDSLSIFALTVNEPEPTPTPISTDIPIGTPTLVPTPTPFATITPTLVPTQTPTSAPTPTPTSSPTATPRPTATPKPSSTPRPTSTSRPAATPFPTPTPLPLMSQSEVERQVFRTISSCKSSIDRAYGATTALSYLTSYLGQNRWLVEAYWPNTVNYGTWRVDSLTGSITPFNAFAETVRDLDGNCGLPAGVESILPTPTPTIRPTSTPTPTPTPTFAPTPVPNSLDYFFLDSTKDEVLAVQGTPTGIDDYTFSGDTWWYDFSTVKFDTSDKVVGWSNTSGNLKLPTVNTSLTGAFELGSTKGEVLAVQGTPTGIDDYTFSGDTWWYDFSTVKFDTSDKVVGWSNTSGNLKLPTVNTSLTGAFELGSTKGEVLAVQGTPTGIDDYTFSGDTWWYDFSTVKFDTSDKVVGWSNTSGNLKVR